MTAYFVVGVLFGVVLTKGELVSWYRIEEALRFKGLYLYLVFASALAVAAPGFALLKRLRARSLAGEPIAIPPKVMGRGVRYVAGGALFGLGWGIVGACPGPLFALIGAGVGVMAVVCIAALVGTWTYGYLRPRLPH
ncbi:MAG: transporter [Gemmatimonadetes bacterium]|nr:MAG: transporter [Gemmatimonadota bacterium]